MATKIIKERENCFIKDMPFENGSQFEDEDCYVDKVIKCDKNMNNVYIEETYESVNNFMSYTKKTPKSILINHETDRIASKSKPNRVVSFTMDAEKKPFTSSIYYGVKSYLHHFYEPVKTTSIEDEMMAEDDFEFVVEPGRRKSKCWFCLSILTGVLLLLFGIVLMLIGHLTPLKNPIIGIQHNLEILDQKAINFNKNMETFQFSGLIIFCAGGIIIMLTLLVSAYEQECGCYDVRNQLSYPSLIDTNAWIRYVDSYPTNDDNRIPLSQEIKAVQIEKK